MDKKLLYIDREYAKEKGKISIEIYEDKQSTMNSMAEMMHNGIVKNNVMGRKTLYIVPVGPVDQYEHFVELVNTNKTSLHDVTFINMDEYMENEKDLIDISSPLSFRKFMNENVYSKIDEDLIMTEEQRIFPTQDNNDYISSIIDEHGFVDCCFGGIGINGHVAFNEPGEGLTDDEFKALGVRVTAIAHETRVVNGINEFKGAYEFMPKYCVTVGFNQILRAKQIRLFCMRDWHEGVIKRALFEKPSNKFPVSLLQEHPDTVIGFPDYLI